MQQNSDECNGTLLFTPREVAKKLALGRSKVYEMAKAGLLPVVKIGTAVRIPCAELVSWIRRRTSQST
jgi:excisionase family DNA binding protein